MKTFLIILLITVVGLGIIFFRPQPVLMPSSEQAPMPIATTPVLFPRSEVIAENLEIPWDLAFLPDGRLLVTERPGRLLIIDVASGSRQEIVSGRVAVGGEGGLLGLVLHPDFAINRFIYLYRSAPGLSGETENRVVRYKLTEAGELTEEKMIISDIPGAIYHDGGRLEFGPDGRHLYITTGDATRPGLAQDRGSLGGKILRLTDGGDIPTSNPFGTAVYSYGHRNPQGLAWDGEGRLWSIEHGRSGVLSGYDEINLITIGGNYGWPTVQGSETGTGLVPPARHSGADTTWAPASLAYLNGRLFFGGLRGEALYEAVLDGEKVVELKEHFKNEFGRIRTVRVGPDGLLYLTTSNRDDRGEPRSGDDKIIRINPALLTGN